MNYNFVQLDPRPNAQNPAFDFGVEVTMKMPQGIPNLDHHRPGDTAETPSACEQALTCGLPLEGCTLATVRPDADSVTAMAVLESRMTSRTVNADLVKAISMMDRFGPRVEGDLPYKDMVIAIARRSADFKVSLAERVAFVQACLDGTADMGLVFKLVAERDAEFTAAEKASEVLEIVPGKLVFVQSTHRFATNLGYRHATTVVAFNPEMAVLVDGKPSGETYRKYTICRYDSNVATDMTGALAELQAFEAGWGGRGDIFGSPQNVSSTLTPEQVTEIVAKYIQ